MDDPVLTRLRERLRYIEDEMTADDFWEKDTARAARLAHEHATISARARYEFGWDRMEHKAP
jgi:hypothetical protein